MFPLVAVIFLIFTCLAIEATCTIERAVARGAFVSQSVGAVWERCLALRLNVTSQDTAENILQPDVVTEGENNEQLGPRELISHYFLILQRHWLFLNTL